MKIVRHGANATDSSREAAHKSYTGVWERLNIFRKAAEAYPDPEPENSELYEDIEEPARGVDPHTMDIDGLVAAHEGIFLQPQTSAPSATFDTYVGGTISISGNL